MARAPGAKIYRPGFVHGKGRVHAIPVPQLPMEASDEWWLRWVLEAVTRVAFHETREALRYRGGQYFRPAHHGQPDRDGSEHPHADVPWPSPGPWL